MRSLQSACLSSDRACGHNGCRTSVGRSGLASGRKVRALARAFRSDAKKKVFKAQTDRLQETEDKWRSSNRRLPLGAPRTP